MLGLLMNKEGHKTNAAYLLTDLQLSCKDFRNAFDQLLAERKK